MAHKYAVGQKVDLIHRMLQISPSGQYEISRLMPDTEDGTADWLYRIKSTDETYQRVVQESELRPTKIGGTLALDLSPARSDLASRAAL